MTCPHGIDPEVAFCFRCDRTTGPLIAKPIQPPDTGPTFVDGPGASMTVVWNGFTIRYSAPTVEELVRLTWEYHEKNRS